MIEIQTAVFLNIKFFIFCYLLSYGQIKHLKNLFFVFSYRSMNVTRTSYEIEGRMINMDFVITPTYQHPTSPPAWTDFFQRVSWNTTLPPPKNLLCINLENHGIFMYRRCPPFFLDQDPCANWLEWIIYETPIPNGPIKMLHVKNGMNPNNIRNNTSICTHIMYELYTSQLEAKPIEEPATPVRHCTIL